MVFVLKYFENESMCNLLFPNSLLECPQAVSPDPTSGLLSTTDHYEGIKVTLNCSSGYTLVGKANTTCNSGIWSPKLGICKQGEYNVNM